jgi:hypothetical protein
MTSAKRWCERGFRVFPLSANAMMLTFWVLDTALKMREFSIVCRLKLKQKQQGSFLQLVMHATAVPTWLSKRQREGPSSNLKPNPGRAGRELAGRSEGSLESERPQSCDPRCDACFCHSTVRTVRSRVQCDPAYIAIPRTVRSRVHCDPAYSAIPHTLRSRVHCDTAHSAIPRTLRSRVIAIPRAVRSRVHCDPAHSAIPRTLRSRAQCVPRCPSRPCLSNGSRSGGLEILKMRDH